MADQLDGIDVSYAQDRIDWTGVQTAGLAFAFAKATQISSGTDSQFSNNWSGMKSAGLTRGAYLYYMDGRDPAQQAQAFISAVTLEPGDLPPAIDVETVAQDDKARRIADLHTCAEALASHYGKPPIIYTRALLWNANFDGSFSDGPLWVSEYTEGNPRSVDGWPTWSFWQHSKSGRISGISKPVDLDRFNGGAAQLKALTLS